MTDQHKKSQKRKSYFPLDCRFYSRGTASCARVSVMLRMDYQPPRKKEDRASRLGFLNLKTLCQDLTRWRLCFVEDIVQVGQVRDNNPHSPSIISRSLPRYEDGGQSLFNPHRCLPLVRTDLSASRLQIYGEFKDFWALGGKRASSFSFQPFFYHKKGGKCE